MRSPFKFLDPFTLADKDVFFGREKETQQLYRQVLRTRLLLLYGLSGTGKTSLIQCGLAGKFNGPDWLPIWVRRQSNINDSLQTSIKSLLPDAEGSINEQIRQLYQQFLRPVYLIFDQFEELLILGTSKQQKNAEEKDTEQAAFVKTLKAILDEELPCTVIIVIREEYLGRLYLFEKAIPGLFDFRLRVELMDNANIKTVLKKSFQKFNISVENPEEARLDEIIENVSQERSRIELPYLQVYLDQFYREDFERTYPNYTDYVGENWLPIEFTEDEIKNFGTIDKVLDTFLNEQTQLIQNKLLTHDPSTPIDTVKLVLDGFVSDEGTKRPVRYTRTNGYITIAPAQQDCFPELPEPILTTCLDGLEKAKILRYEFDVIEIAHDSLAKIIDNKRTAEQRERNNMKRQIRLAADMFSKTGEYLTRKQLVKFEDLFAQLEPKEQQFFEASKQFRQEEEQKELEEEKQRNAELKKALDNTNAAKKEAEENEENAKQSTNRAILIAIIAVIALFAALFAWCTAKSANAKADSALAKNQRIIDAFYFYNDRFALALKEVRSEKKYGFIDKNGDPVIDYIYDEATPFDDYDGYARVTKSRHKYLLDTLKNEYLLAQDINELNDQTLALDLHAKQLSSIPIAIFKHSQLKVLLLYSDSLKEVPAQLWELKNLQRLNLNKNPLERLPAQIGTLTNLQKLGLSRTQLTELPTQIGELKNLQSLDLSGITSLTGLPTQLWTLTNLQTLSLRGITSLTALPTQIGNLKRLQRLDLSQTSLKDLPAQIGELKQLQTLYLSNNSKLDSLPRQLWTLTSLQRLDLGQTSLSGLSAQISQLKSLKRLDLSYNAKLVCIPAQIGELKSLQRLDLSNNTNLKSLPVQLWALQNLQTLNLSGITSLTSLPAQIGGLKSLQTLDLSGITLLTGLPTQLWTLKNLQSLNLNNKTLLTSLPTRIGELKNLQSLNLSLMTSLTGLPTQIGELKSLQELNLSYNSNLQSIPTQIGELKNLQILNLTGITSLTGLPTQIGELKSLKILYMGNNSKVDSLPTQIGKLTSLQTLNLGYTKLKSLPVQFWELKNLQSLNLSGVTSLTNIPTQIGELKNLQTLDLSGITSLTALPTQLWTLTNLQTLNLSGITSLTALPPQIGNLKRLQRLDISQTCISKEEISKIKKWLPTCEIIASNASPDQDCINNLAIPIRSSGIK